MKKKTILVVYSYTLANSPLVRAVLEFLDMLEAFKTTDITRDLAERQTSQYYVNAAMTHDMVILLTEPDGFIGKGIYSMLKDVVAHNQSVYTLEDPEVMETPILRHVVGMELNDPDDWKGAYGKVVVSNIRTPFKDLT